MEVGKDLKKVASTHVVKGKVNIIYVKIILNLGSNFNALIIAKSPVSTVICGNMVIAKIIYIDGCFPLNLNLPIAKPAKDPATNANKVVDIATMELLIRPYKNSWFCTIDL